MPFLSQWKAAAHATLALVPARPQSPNAFALQHVFEQQDDVFANAFSILTKAIADHAFPAAAIAVTFRGQLLALKSFGTFTFENELPNPQETRAVPPLSRLLRPGSDVDSLSVTTLFDLASLTKPIATTTMAAILYERGQLELDAPVAGTLPEFRQATDPRRDQVTFRMLLAHSSGLPAYEKLFLKAHSRDELLHAAFNMPLTANPGSRAEYSDIGFIILGSALVRLAQESLDTFCQREVFGPAGMSHTTFNPPEEIRKHIPPTADETGGRSTFRNRVIQGEVQDENACVLGGVAAHAGLFSTAPDLAKFAHLMLQGGSPILHPETVALFTHRESSPQGTSRALGWDTASQPSQSGKYFGPNSFGHLGYTGTSLWIDPDRQLSITLLTNRTWPDCSNQAIKQIRPKFHDAIIEALEDLD